MPLDPLPDTIQDTSPNKEVFFLIPVLLAYVVSVSRLQNKHVSQTCADTGTNFIHSTS